MDRWLLHFNAIHCLSWEAAYRLQHGSKVDLLISLSGGGDEKPDVLCGKDHTGKEV
jgi:hypothetical protein